MGQWRIRASERTNSDGKHSDRKKGPLGLLWTKLEGVAEQSVVGAISSLFCKKCLTAALS
jgi:hypothetical protein